MSAGDIGGIIGAVAGVGSLVIVIFDKARKGAKIKAIVEGCRLDGQTQRESKKGSAERNVHYCVFTFGIRLENNGNEICTLTHLKLDSGREGHDDPLIELDDDERYLQIPPGTPGFFKCVNQLIFEGSPPSFPITLNVTLNFIGHKPISVSIPFESDGLKYF